MKKPIWVLIGSDTLLGKECREFVEMEKLPVVLRLAGAAADERVLTEADGEAAVVEPLDEEMLESANVVLLAGDAESGRAAMAMAHGAKRVPTFVDVAGAHEDLPHSRLRAPMVEEEGAEFPPGTVHTIAHPGASALVRALSLIHDKRPIRSAVVTVLEPVSAYGTAGIDELHKQTVGLFSFQQLPKQEFDTQAAFNLTPRYGDEGRAQRTHSATRIEKHVASLLGPKRIPLPSIRLVHAPVFHGYCQSVWISFDDCPSAAALEGWLEEAGIDVHRRGAEPASNVSVAGQGGIAVSDVGADASNPSAIWLWMASDNLRTSAENAALVAGMLSRKHD
jgi:aspartate-semialdehyde dehydrogenase